MIFLLLLGIVAAENINPEGLSFSINDTEARHGSHDATYLALVEDLVDGTVTFSGGENVFDYFDHKDNWRCNYGSNTDYHEAVYNPQNGAANMVACLQYCFNDPACSARRAMMHQRGRA